MTLYECRALAERRHPEKLQFTLTTPSGSYKAEWLDPYLGLFIVPSIGPGTVNVHDLARITHDCAVENQATPERGPAHTHQQEREQPALRMRATN